MVEQALRDPISVGMLKTNGNRLMEQFHVEPGPRIGWTLSALLEDVLEKPERNTEEYLDRRTRELLKLSDNDLRELGESGKRRQEAEEAGEVEKIMKRHGVA